jgi:predicted CxxxxCH...CXXCH cytochrome family protein
VVEAELMSLPELHRQWVLRLDPPRQRELLKGGTMEQWDQHATAAVQEVVSNWLIEMSPRNARGAEDVAKVIQDVLPQDDRSGSDPRALALYMAFGAHDQAGLKSASCAKCHDLEDVIGARARSSSASTQPAVAVPVLRTLATAIPSTPRRWFTNSRFDHRAHEGLDCLTCHSRAEESEKTSDLLLPNLTWKDGHGASLSCAQCHHPGGSEAAPSHCTTCHTFHDGPSSAPPRKQGVIELLRGTPAPPPAPPAATASNVVIRN